ncbi:MAG TPA: hypothetical protein VK448_11140, partial [Dissulfurispiraceae bacterium]|nr:hypothetical protein [Dissulfurispiraceae bacterium]
DVVMIAPRNEALVLYKLRSPNEIRNLKEVPLLQAKPVNKDQLKLARNLVESMSTTLDKLDLADKYHDALKAVIDAKIAGKEIVAVEEAEKPVTDIMTALKQSIERAKTHRKHVEKTAAL